MPLLGKRFAAVVDGDVYVPQTISRHTTLATTTVKCVGPTGEAAWPKYWKTLRASCETDLMNRYDLRKACAWVGNSPIVAINHCALLKKTDYIEAGGKSAEEPSGINRMTRLPNLKNTEFSHSSSRSGTRTRTRFNPPGILSPVRLPFRHPAMLTQIYRALPSEGSHRFTRRHARSTAFALAILFHQCQQISGQSATR